MVIAKPPMLVVGGMTKQLDAANLAITSSPSVRSSMASTNSAKPPHHGRAQQERAGVVVERTGAYLSTKSDAI